LATFLAHHKSGSQLCLASISVAVGANSCRNLQMHIALQADTSTAFSAKIKKAYDECDDKHMPLRN